MTKDDPDLKKRAKIQFDPEPGAEMWDLVNKLIPVYEQEQRATADRIQRENPTFRVEPLNRWSAPRLVLDLLRKEAMRLGIEVKPPT